MPRPRTKRQLVAALCLAALAPARAGARKPAREPAPAPLPTADQQDVIAAVVADTFPRPKRERLAFTLCLDVQIASALDEAAPPQRRQVPGRRSRAAAPPPNVRGAPPELVSRLQRPWRVVSSALACRLDPDEPIALDDARHTPAQLVTVRLAPDVSTGSIRIDWTEGRDHTAMGSRDCTAEHGPHGWNVRCAGTWYQ